MTGVLTVNANAIFNSSVLADSLTAGSLVVSGNTSLVNTANTAHLLPHSNNTYDIGSSSLKYRNIYGALKGNADTATEFSANQSVTLTGHVTGTASSKAGWSIQTTITAGAVTNAMLAGSITNSKLINPFVQLSGHTVYLGDNIDLTDLLPDLGLDNATHFVGHAT